MRRKYILDANLIVLYAVGLTDVRLIKAHKRLSNYRREDFDILEALLLKAGEVTSLPNAWTEASNLLGPNDSSPQQAEIFLTFQKLVEKLGCRYVPSAEAVVRAEFKFLGLTDSALLELAKAGFTILSVDATLCIAAEHAGLKAQNFNHLRRL